MGFILPGRETEAVTREAHGLNTRNERMRVRACEREKEKTSKKTLQTRKYENN